MMTGMKTYRGRVTKRKLADRKGFTLLEILVALTLVAVTVTVILQLFSANLRSVAWSEDYVSTSVKAEAKMRELLDREDLEPGVWTEETDEGFRMEVAVEEALMERTKDMAVQVMEIVLTVSWKRGEKTRKMTLRTLKAVERKV